MRWMIASDIHGSALCCRKLMERFEQSRAERLLLLGDLLYHGPRNDLPAEYCPKEVIEQLNRRKDRIYAVRGNCEAEVDQMVLEFPVMADYCLIALPGRVLYATHGHVYNEEHLPPMRKGDVLLYGHTHIWTARREKDFFFLNPGSVSIPKNGNPCTYAMLEDSTFQVRHLETDEILAEMNMEETI